MRKAERVVRDRRVVRLVLAGLTYAEVAQQVGLRSPASVSNIIDRELGAEQRRALGSGHAAALLLERSEALWSAHYPRALQGDHRSAVVCLRVMAQQQRALAASAGTDDDDDLIDDDPEDELAAYRIGRKRRRTG